MTSPELDNAEPCYEQAVCDLAKATEEQRAEITRLTSELAASRERERALERERDAVREMRKRLDRRIHKQRVALRQNWEIIEMRSDYYAHRGAPRSRLLACALDHNRRAEAAEAEVKRLRAALRDIAALEPGTQEWIDKIAVSDGDRLAGQAFLIARRALADEGGDNG